MIERWTKAACGIVSLLILVSGAWGQNAGQLFFEGFELIKGGKPQEAASKFEEGLKADPMNALARFYLGEAYLSAGQNSMAQEQFRQSLKLDPHSEVAEDARKRLSELSDNAVTGGAGARTGGGTTLPAVGTVIRDCAQCPELVVIPSGRFVLGSPRNERGRGENEGPPRIVTFAAPLAVGKYEITFQEWDRCVDAGGCTQVQDEGWGRARLPVINVTWGQAVDFTRWLSKQSAHSYRLLSEAEWEYAARAGTQEATFWSAKGMAACQFANVSDLTRKRVYKLSTDAFECDDGQATTAPVGTFRANAFGLYDMLGNVWEWVADCHNDSYVGAPADGSAWTAGNCNRHMTRGGSWYDKPEVVRFAQRSWAAAKDRSSNVGFRVARSLP